MHSSRRQSCKFNPSPFHPPPGRAPSSPPSIDTSRILCRGAKGRRGVNAARVVWLASPCLSTCKTHFSSAERCALSNTRRVASPREAFWKQGPSRVSHTRSVLSGPGRSTKPPVQDSSEEGSQLHVSFLGPPKQNTTSGAA